ncbi:PadR family transcriptional regulator [Nocardioides guangzhouensis]|uniref:PadR family transcriptional regulator n=1 Tax=Nocardioides guangzhouensis TaxID=2497878 RepID=A0A4V1XYS2_9ACTN|nr:PadR family transcriptional regulator [Nocardioides guangzhouensis]
MKARRTQARLAIAAALLAGPQSVKWGYELSRQAGVGAGSMYPFLAELLAAGHLTDGWEEQPAAGRPARRYYRITDSGEEYLRDFLASAPAANRSRRHTAIRRRPGTVEP